MAFEPLFEASSLKLLMAMDYAQAAKSCAKMLAVRVPERVEAVLKAIADSGMNPWSVAVVGGPKSWGKLAPLGVIPSCIPDLQKQGFEPMPGGFGSSKNRSATFQLFGCKNPSIPLVECGGLVVNSADGAVFPLLENTKSSINVNDGNASFPVLKTLLGTLNANQARVEVEALTFAGGVDAAGKGSLIVAPSLALADRVEVEATGAILADQLRLIRSLLSVQSGSVIELPGLVYLLGELRIRDKGGEAVLPALKELGRINTYGDVGGFTLQSLQKVHTGISILSARPTNVFSTPALESVAGGIHIAVTKAAPGAPVSGGVKPFLSLKRVTGDISVPGCMNISTPVLDEVVGAVNAKDTVNFSAPRLTLAELGVDLTGAVGANVPLAQGLMPLAELVSVSVSGSSLGEIEISSDLKDFLEPEVA